MMSNVAGQFPPILGFHRFLCIDVDESGRYREKRLTKPLEFFGEFLNIGFTIPHSLKKCASKTFISINRGMTARNGYFSTHKRHRNI